MPNVYQSKKAFSSAFVLIRQRDVRDLSKESRLWHARLLTIQKGVQDMVLPDDLTRAVGSGFFSPDLWSASKESLEAFLLCSSSGLFLLDVSANRRLLRPPPHRRSRILASSGPPKGPIPLKP